MLHLPDALHNVLIPGDAPGRPHQQNTLQVWQGLYQAFLVYPPPEDPHRREVDLCSKCRKTFSWNINITNIRGACTRSSGHIGSQKPHLWAELMRQCQTWYWSPQVGLQRSSAQTGLRNVGAGERPHHAHELPPEHPQGHAETKSSNRSSIWECGWATVAPELDLVNSFKSLYNTFSVSGSPFPG